MNEQTKCGMYVMEYYSYTWGVHKAVVGPYHQEYHILERKNKSLVVQGQLLTWHLMFSYYPIINLKIIVKVAS